MDKHMKKCHPNEPLVEPVADDEGQDDPVRCERRPVLRQRYGDIPVNNSSFGRRAKWSHETQRDVTWVKKLELAYVAFLTSSRGKGRQLKAAGKQQEIRFLRRLHTRVSHDLIM